MKKFLRVFAILILVIVGALVTIGIVLHEDKPEGTPTAEADALAEKMIEAVNKEAWDETRFVQWTFAGVHHYLWDKERNIVQVRWDDKEALIELDVQEGQAFEAGVALEGKEKEKLVHRGWTYFCNDSFWINAVVKAFDPGTSRSLVTLEDGREGLMVSYSSGGTTPGDSYVWILDENHRPTSWKMWVGIIPVGGLEATWEDWKTMPTGALIAESHAFMGIQQSIENLKAGQDLEAMGLTENPFEAAGMY